MIGVELEETRVIAVRIDEAGAVQAHAVVDANVHRAAPDDIGERRGAVQAANADAVP